MIEVSGGTFNYKSKKPYLSEPLSGT